MDLNINKTNIDYGDALFTIYDFNGEKEYRKNDSVVLHCHKWYELHFIIEGKHEFNIENKKIPVKQNELLIIKPETEHYSWEGGENYKRISVSLDLKRREGKEGCYDYFKESLDNAQLLQIKVNSELMNSIKKIAAISEETTIKDICKKKYYLGKVIYELFELLNGFSVKNEKNLKVIPDVTVSLDVMVNNPLYRMEDISAELGYSERHTARLIKSIYNESLSDMRERRAFEKAKKLLEESEKSIEEVATESGFESSVALRRAFKKREGITPLEFKKRILQKKTEF